MSAFRRLTAVAAACLGFAAIAEAEPRGASMYLPSFRVADEQSGPQAAILAAVHVLRLAGVDAVDEAANRNGVPIALARAVMRMESGGRCSARSRSGALGVMQVLPATARAMGVTGRLTDCQTGAEAGVRYLKRIIAAHGVGCAAIALYERGEFARLRCTGYGRKVLRLTVLP